MAPIQTCPIIGILAAAPIKKRRQSAALFVSADGS
jgi:hypothetical protein